MDLNEIIIQPNMAQKNIEKILLKLEKKRIIDFNSQKYDIVNQLVDFRKSDLETAKSNLEHNIEQYRISAPILVLLSTFCLGFMSLFRQDLLWIRLISFSILTFFVFLGFKNYPILVRQLARLHVIKIAIAQKLDATNLIPPENKFSVSKLNSVETE